MRKDNIPVVGGININNEPIEENKADNFQDVYETNKLKVAGIGTGIKLLKESITLGKKELEEIKTQSKQIKEDTEKLPEAQQEMIKKQKELQKKSSGVFNKKENEFGQVIKYIDRKTKKAWKDSGLDPSKYRPSGTDADGNLYYTVDDLAKAKKEYTLNPDNIDADTVVPPDNFIIENVNTKVDPNDFLNAIEGDLFDFKIELKNTTSDLDYAKIINYVQNKIKDKIDLSKRGVLADKVIVALAKELRIEPDLLKRKIGGTFNAEQLLASRYLLLQSAKEVREIGERMKNIGFMERASDKGQILAAEFATAFNRHGAITMQIMGARAEAGRALRSFGIPVGGAEGIADPRVVTEIMNEIGGSRNVYDLAEQVLKRDNSILNQMSRKGVEAGPGGIMGFIKNGWRSYYQSSLLWSPASLERNLFGTLSQIIAKPFDTFYGATIGKGLDDVFYKPLYGAKRQDKMYAMESLIQIYQLITSIPEAISVGAKSFFKYESQFQKQFSDALIDTDRMGGNLWTKFDKDFNWMKSYKDNFVTYGLEYAIKNIYALPFRGVLAGDDLSKHLLYKMESRSQAYRRARQAYEQGMPEDKVLEAFGYDLADPDPTLLKNVIEETNKGTFTNKLTKVEQKLDSFFKFAGPLGALAVPFLKTLLKVSARTHERLPTALAQSFVPRNSILTGRMGEGLEEMPIMGDLQKALNAGGAARQQALGQMTTGVSILMYGAYLAHQGKITGALGGRDQSKEIQDLAGITPNSILTYVEIKDKDGNVILDKDNNPKTKPVWQNLYGLDPIGKLLNIGASIYEISSNADPDDPSYLEMIKNATLLSYSQLTNTEWAGSLGNFVDLITSSSQYSENQSKESYDKMTNALENIVANSSRTFPGGQPWLPMPMPGVPLVNQMGIYFDKDREKVKAMYDPSIYNATDRIFLHSWDQATSKLPMFNKNVKPQRNIFGEKIRYAQPNMWNWLFPFWDSEENLTPLKQKIIDINQATGDQVINMPSRKVANIDLNGNEYSDMLLLMNNVRINNKTFQETVATILDDVDNKNKMQINSYDKVVKEIRKAATQYKNHVFFKDSKFKELYPETHGSIMANKIRISSTSAVKRKERKTGDLFILREIKKDIKEAVK